MDLHSLESIYWHSCFKLTGFFFPPLATILSQNPQITVYNFIYEFLRKSFKNSITFINIVFGKHFRRKENQSGKKKEMERETFIDST